MGKTRSMLAGVLGLKRREARIDPRVVRISSIGGCIHYQCRLAVSMTFNPTSRPVAVVECHISNFFSCHEGLPPQLKTPTMLANDCDTA